MIYHEIEDCIGNTPLLKLDGKKWGFKNTDVYVKLEYLNPWGSIKDRTALGITKQCKWEPGKNILESSSGNTAKALQLLASRRGSQLTSVSNRVNVQEVQQQLQYFGAEMITLPGNSECPDPAKDNNPLNVIRDMQHEQPKKYFHTNQYENSENTQVHRQTTAAELYDDLGNIDVIVTGVGTGGSSGGVIEYARLHQKKTTCIGVMSEPSDFLPGIRTRDELFETNIFHADAYDSLVEVASRSALVALRELVQQEGVLAGPTTGANFAAVREYLQHNDKLVDGRRQTLVFIACDRLETYMSYIMKRQPEVFERDQYADMYSVTVSAHEQREYEKPVSEQTAAWIESDSVLVVDTRSTDAYEAFSIPGAVNFPENQLIECMSAGTPFQGTVLLVCSRGHRALQFAKVLRGRGCNAYSLAGGIAEWRAGGLPLKGDLLCN